MTRRLWLVALELWLPVVVLIGWWVWSAGAAEPFFPPLREILTRFREMWLFDQFVSDVLPSLRNMVVGFAIASVVGIAVGMVLARVRLLREALEPLMHFVRATPGVALVPIFILLLGFGPSMKISIIATAAVFPTIIATMDGVRSADPVLLDISRAYQLTRRQRVTKVLLPAAGPQIFAGLQVSLQVAFVVMIASEMLGSTEGIGALTLLAQQSFAVTDMWSGIVLLGLLGYLVNLLFLLARSRVLHWYDGTRKAAKE
ncbi:ABC transporter permease [Nocardioides kongjuensis]|uniref:ABC-type nitrate/sulfonate/bicarbonate transport system permease component n=1 Tax=Nocardioides kongjuensis TaxID=349522 RepID=A0A852RJ63_9ACTN|nr:ABC transporter permease [Nocardioides kongjuensis]NYD30619.1 ABC-type nitrate/sulfonate/bicarbonate transport system permease component [Nocardioides kongjuensis]